MRLLVAIPHYVKPAGKPGGARRHGSASSPREFRAAALARSIAAIHQLFAGPQCQFRFDDWTTPPANSLTAGEVEVLIFTARGAHVVDMLPRLAGSIWHYDLAVEPPLLGFECHAALRDRIGRFDYFAYLEDDLVLHDPWFLAKLGWFNRMVGGGKLLQPNRYEVSREGPVYKAYIDGDLPPGTSPWLPDVSREPMLHTDHFDLKLSLRRASNPHSGCFFLNARQMEEFAARPYFLDRDTSFIGPLESAASLGILRTFDVYKPAPPVASFLEVEHSGTAFLRHVKAGGKLK